MLEKNEPEDSKDKKLKNKNQIVISVCENDGERGRSGRNVDCWTY